MIVKFLVFLISLVILIPTYKIIKYLLIGLKIGNDITQGNIAILITLCLFPFILGGNWGARVMVMEYFQRHEFNQKIWLEKKEERHLMVNHMINSQMLIGKTKEEIVSILGKDYFMDCYYSFLDDSKECMNYEIGSVAKIFSTVPCVLMINFNEGKAIFVSQEYHAYYF